MPEMIITIDIPEELLNEAMKVSHSPTKKQLIIAALENLIRKTKISELKKYKGNVKLDIDMDTLRNRQ
jgi:hypothetical protein